MAFGINLDSVSGNITPIVKYDARAGRMQRVDREDGISTPHDITNNFRAVFDLENVEYGWLAFSASGPDFKLVRLGEALPAKPSENHRQGVRLRLKLAADCGGDVRELATVARVALRGLDELHTRYEAEKANHGPGELPIVTLAKTIPVTSGSGAQKSTNYQPVFEIEAGGWAPRPADLPPKAAPSAASGPANGGAPAASGPANGGFKQLDAPPATGATKVAAPVSRSQPEAAASDFG
jgi:hypothetical protein